MYIIGITRQSLKLFFADWRLGVKFYVWSFVVDGVPMAALRSFLGREIPE